MYDSESHWRVRGDGTQLSFEFYHPPSSRICARCFASGHSRHQVLFNEGTMRWLSEAQDRSAKDGFPLSLPHPLDQLLFVSLLARRRGLLVHACGLMIEGRAVVLAGHSGDGKTTLAGMMAAEGLEVLSDERVAVRKAAGRFVAYGTPWPGEGNRSSPSELPLGAVFVLRKAGRHRALTDSPAALAAELIARSIVPYFSPDDTARILSVVQDLAQSVPLRVLEFSLEPGLVALFREVLSKPVTRLAHPCSAH